MLNYLQMTPICLLADLDLWRTGMIGRTQETTRLDQCMQEENAQLIAIYGRRRVGKTYLINSYFSGRFDFKLTGLFDQPKEMQLRSFIL